MVLDGIKGLICEASAEAVSIFEAKKIQIKTDPFIMATRSCILVIKELHQHLAVFAYQGMGDAYDCENSKADIACKGFLPVCRQQPAVFVETLALAMPRRRARAASPAPQGGARA